MARQVLGCGWPAVIDSRIESPIERRLHNELVMLAYTAGLSVVTAEFVPGEHVLNEEAPGVDCGEVVHACYISRRGANWLFIFPQVSIGQYRADFVLEYRAQGQVVSSLVVVECDGHDFHERTKEQARRDRERDRWMAERGLKLFRFTGQELYEDAAACAAQCHRFLVRQAGEK